MSLSSRARRALAVASVGVTLVGCAELGIRTSAPGVDVRVRGHATWATAGVEVVEPTPTATAVTDIEVVDHGDAAEAGVTVVEQSDAATGEGTGMASGTGTADGAGIAVDGSTDPGSRTTAHGDAHASAGVDGAFGASGSGSAAGTAAPGGSVTVSCDACDAPERVRDGDARGVRAVGGGRARLSALLEGGLDVDGYRVSLADIGPIAGALEAHAAATGSAATDAQLRTDASIDARIEVEHDTLAYEGGETNVVVRIAGGDAATTARGRLRVHLVLDRSSSMQSSWHEVVAAARILLRELGPDDEIHIVAYGTDAEEVLAVTRVGDGNAARRALAGVRVGGGTHIEAGLRLAYRAAARSSLRGNDRSLVILVSDGVPTEGAFGSDELGAMATRAREHAGCTTTVVGVGNQFDARVLRAVAREGRGGYHVARTADRLAGPLTAELRAHTQIAARDVDLDLRLPADVEVVGIADGEAGVSRQGNRVKLRMPWLAAGEERRIVVRVRVPRGSDPRTLASASLAWRAAGTTRVSRASKDALVSFGPEAHAAGSTTGIAVLDADLGATLDVVAEAVANGDRVGAASALRAHTGRARAHARIRTEPALRHRTDSTDRLATAIEALLDTADHTERRELSLALGALSLRFAR